MEGKLLDQETTTNESKDILAHQDKVSEFFLVLLLLMLLSTKVLILLLLSLLLCVLVSVLVVEVTSISLKLRFLCYCCFFNVSLIRTHMHTHVPRKVIQNNKRDRNFANQA